MKKKIKLIYKLSNNVHRCFQTAYRLTPINMFLFVTHPQAFTENIFLIFYIWCLFEQLLEQLPHTILSHYISVPALWPFEAHLIASWAGQLAGPSVNLGVLSQKLQELQFSRNSRSCSALAVPVCQIWRELDLPSCQALLTLELSLIYPGLSLSFTYHEWHMDHHGYNFGN